jgi:hypothetical protein
LDSVAVLLRSYSFDATEELFMYALDNENDQFMKYALQESFFNIKILEKDEIINKILNLLEKGSKIEYCLNILLYANFAKWKMVHNNKLVNIINRIVLENDQKNIILLTANTLMALAHCQEFLKIIGWSMKLFKRRANYIIDRLSLLIEKIIAYTDNDLIESIFLDRDFKERTLLKIVTHNQLSAFLKSTKSTVLMDAIWRGIYASE